MIEYEVLSCPFCGVYPQVTLGSKRGCQLHGEPMQGVYVRCSNNKCKVIPQTPEFGDIFHDKLAAINLAVDNWNIRTYLVTKKKREFKL